MAYINGKEVLFSATVISTEEADELKRILYYGDAEIMPSPENLFKFTVDNETMTAKIIGQNGDPITGIAGDIVIPYEYEKDNKKYRVTSIGGNAFYYCISLKSITIPNSITFIGSGAFYDCGSLKSITIPDSITTIESYAFYGCGMLEVYFNGTKEQWTNITTGYFDETDTLLNATIHYNEDYEAGIEDGRKTENDTFWDRFQQEGNRQIYIQAFSYDYFDNRIFKPKYQIKPTDATQMFYKNQVLSGEVEGVINIDFANCTNFQQVFQDFNKITRLGVIDMSKATTATNAFAFCSGLVTIDKIIMSETTPIVGFTGVTNLKNVRFEGVIAKNISFKACPLTVESTISVLTHLANYTDNAGVYTITLNDETKTAMATAGALAELDGKTYDTYIADKGWNLA